LSRPHGCTTRNDTPIPPHRYDLSSCTCLHRTDSWYRRHTPRRSARHCPAAPARVKATLASARRSRGLDPRRALPDLAPADRRQVIAARSSGRSTRHPARSRHWRWILAVSLGEVSLAVTILTCRAAAARTAG
jgi:hypothetical protein